LITKVFVKKSEIKDKKTIKNIRFKENNGILKMILVKKKEKHFQEKILIKLNLKKKMILKI
jgi:hypothetical protein